MVWRNHPRGYWGGHPRCQRQQCPDLPQSWERWLPCKVDAQWDERSDLQANEGLPLTDQDTFAATYTFRYLDPSIRKKVGDEPGAQTAPDLRIFCTVSPT